MALPSELRKLLWANIACFIVFIYIGIFVNLYIWEKHRNIGEVAWFNLIMFLCWPAAFTIAAQLLSRYTIRLLLGLSSIFGLLTFLLLSLFRIENEMHWIALIAIPTGVMWAFFSAVQNLCVSQFGKGQDFGVFFSLNNTIIQILNMTVPIVSALVIRAFGFNSSFLLMLVFVCAMFAVSLTLPPFSLKPFVKDKWSELFRFRKIFEPSGTTLQILSSAFAGMFLQFQALFVLLFTFAISSDKLEIAFLNSLYTSCSIAALIIYRNVHIPDHRWLWIGLLLIGLGFSAVLATLPIFLVISNLLTTAGVFYFNTAWNSGQFKAIGRHQGIWQVRFLIWRETVICLTRSIMLVLVMNIHEFGGTYFYCVMVLASLSLLSIPLCEIRMQRPSSDVQPM